MSNTPLVRTPPAKLAMLDVQATPFKLMIPKELTQEDARVLYDALLQHDGIVLADPFALIGVSTVFPGIFYNMDPNFKLEPVAELLGALDLESLEDSWLEVWAPETYDDVAEALDITDLTNPSSNGGE